MKFISSIFLILTIIYSAVGGYQYKKLLLESIQVIKEDISLDIASAQMMSAQRKIETLKNFGFIDLKVETNPSLNNLDFFSSIVRLEVDGLFVGYIVDRPSLKTIIAFTAGTAYLGIVFAIVFLLMVFCIVLPLEKYKRGVQKFIRDSRELPLSTSDSKDEVTSEIQKIIEKNLIYLSQINELSYKVRETEAVSNLAKQVAHDIRSPLSVLKLLVPSLAKNPSQERAELILQSTKRIEAISEALLRKGDSINQNLLTQISVYDLKQLIKEKQIEMDQKYHNLKIETVFIDKANVFQTRVSKLDFERIISNLLNNAAESMEKHSTGVINLTFSIEDNKTNLIIKDNGKGIDPKVISKLGTKGFSHGKEDGNGLGIYHAKSVLEKAGGGLNITSSLETGTTVMLTL